MKSESVKEQSSLSLVIKSEQGKDLLFDRLDFPVAPREQLRLELQKGLKAVVR
jgi:hypothetical protein